MDENQDQKSRQQNPEEDKLTARRVSLLECVNGRAMTGRKESVIIVTLGHPDASVDQIALAVPDAKKLLYRLAVALRHKNTPLGPATEQKILRRWVVPHSVGRAELNVEDEEQKYLEELHRDIPELAEYVVTQMNILRCVLQRVVRGSAKPEALMKRVKRVVLIALDAGRSGT